MIVDVQRGFVVPDTAPTLQTIARFIETERDWREMMSEDEVALLPEVARAAEIVVSKHGLAPDPEELVSVFRDRDIRTVDLCGFDTDQCVLATALLLWE